MNSVTTTYAYDDIDQLLSESRSGYSASYTYDANGNRATKTLGGSTDTYHYDDADKLTSITNGMSTVKSFGYDTAGRTTSVTVGANTTTLAYDYEGRITTITYPSMATNTFTYNGLNTRVGKVDSVGTATYKRDGADVTSPVLSDGSAVFTPGISERRSSTTKFYGGDRLGTNTLEENTSQTITATKTYDAFGMPVASTGSSASPFGFAGKHGYQEDADSGLKLLGHRYYDPSTGRFLTRDTTQDGRNWYTYCSNNPTKQIDSTGHFAFIAVGVFMLVAFLSTGETSTNDDYHDHSHDADPRSSLLGASLATVLGRPDVAFALLNAVGGRGRSGNVVGSVESEGGYSFSHPPSTIEGDPSYNYWNGKSNEEIMRSLREPGNEQGSVNSDGVIRQGNTRSYILRQRGVPWEQIPLSGTGGGGGLGGLLIE